MSCIVGLKDGKRIWMASDGLASTEDGEIRSRTCKKIFKNGKYVIGYVGSVRTGQILFPEYFEPPKKIYELPDAIRQQCEEKGCLGSSEQSTDSIMSNYLVAFEGKLYEIMTDFQMMEIDDYTAMGSGSSFAFGSLFTTENLGMDSKERVELAIKSAIQFHGTCGGNITIEKI